MDILIKKEVLEKWDINSEDILISPINKEIYFKTTYGIELMDDTTWEIKNNTLTIKLKEEK